MSEALKVNWKAAIANDETEQGFSEWLRENDPEQQTDYNRTVESALKSLFSEEDLERVAAEEDPDAYELTICLSAHQRLTCFVDVVLPGSCDQEGAERLAALLDKEMDGKHYELDPEYWEACATSMDDF